MRRQLGVLALLVLIALPGCGSSSSSSVSTAHFASQLDQLCTQGNAAVRGASSIQAAAATFQVYLNRVRALSPPAGLRATFSQFTSLLDQRLGLLRQNKLEAAKQLHRPISRLATQLGATACAK